MSSARPLFPRLRRSLLPAVALAAIAGGAHATVTQVDGTIIPEGNNLQDALDGEGESLDAILDAAELPEVFLPNLTQAVTFSDVAEGAGFENSIGWYNVGDDVSTAEGRRLNLHPILGCGTTMENHAPPPTNEPSHRNHHHGNPSFYRRTAEPGNSISVDFSAEQAAGRYRGGFIAFYMITPEDSGGSSGGSCGDFPSSAFFGRIYFTQKDLNNDGDFVHHLVYNSTQTPDRFYFGFEDLFRGGDNDFEDMLIAVDGLTPPCIPTPEICGDGIDNDCDGLVDGDDDDVIGVDQPCNCDGVELTCTDGPQLGLCQEGVTVCEDDEIQCTPIVEPEAEICNALDDDCDGQVDDNPAGSGGSCDGSDADQCPDDVLVCEGGAITCVDVPPPADDPDRFVEVCDGIDNDCNGQIDDNPVDGGGSCGSDIGVCTPGELVCQDGAIVCQGATGPSPEVCDGLDNDCDGQTDENPSDAGGTCPGGNPVGVCSPGSLVCSGGALVCVGRIDPTPEICDGLDNDCDGVEDDDPIDVGNPCIEPGFCTPGVIECLNGVPSCEGGATGSPEICNGIDDDCNGQIDDNPSDVGGICGGGACGDGVLQCINGAPECVGGTDGSPEICNGIDDDCDGETDEGELCEGGTCQNGTCSSPCADGEFPCPPGQLCEAGYCVGDPCRNVTCPAGPDGSLQVCVAGACQSICDTTSCPGNLVCRSVDGSCVPNTCHYLPLCGADELCVDAACISDPCEGVDCGDGGFCRAGECVASCAGVICAVGEQCQSGACVATGCPSGCSEGRVCSPSGTCIADPCRSVRCGPGQTCEPNTGECVADPCNGVTCPGAQICRFGECINESDLQPRPEEERVTAAGGGCSAAGSGAAPWPILVLLGLGLALRRRRGRGLLGASALAALLALGGCNTNPYCINCETTRDAGGGFDAGEIDAMTPETLCDMGIVQPEVCDGVDNDCDGDIDEDFDLQSDIDNCGACSASCLREGAQTMCALGTCQVGDCFPGFVDLDGDPANGCEYACFRSNGGVESCDGLDNDCDGEADEDFDLNTDDNCGACGAVCSRFQADAHCVAGTCTFDPDTDCQPGFIDLDGNPSNGCEYACTVSNGGTETCDFRDNDCDGQVDEDTDLASDPSNCGTCGRVCNFLNADEVCTSGTCGIGSCAPGFHDANGQLVDGCEYACTVSNGGVERCDGVDNDCDGVVDDQPSDVGGACSSLPGNVARGVCQRDGVRVCAAGVAVCSGATAPTVETCDTLDNDCDGVTDEGADGTPLRLACYGGPGGTQGVGVCAGGFETCVGGSFNGVCSGQTLPASESCDGFDNDCDGSVDEAGGGGPITQTCYTGTPGSAGQGICESGTQTCVFGSFGTCVGEVTDEPTDFCGDGIDNDCDSADEDAEGCFAIAPDEFRLDGNGGSQSSAPGEDHSFDLVLATGGSPRGANVYAVWSDLGNGNSDVFFRSSSDGGVTWGNIRNLTNSGGHFGDPAVKPFIVVSPGTGSAGADRVYIVYQRVAGGLRSLRLLSSADGGANFTAPDDPLSDPSDDAFHHHAAVSANGQVLSVVWENLDPSSLVRDIFGRVVSGGGATLENRRQLNVQSGANPVAGRPQAAVTSSGRFVWVWREARADATTDVFATFSDSRSAAISAGSERRLDQDGAGTRNSDFPQLKQAGQNLYVVWQDISTQPGGGSDVVFTRSLDNAGSFRPEQIIDDPALEVSSSFTPTLAVDPRGASNSDDRVYIAWEDRRQGTQIFAARSTDSGASFAAPKRASSSGGVAIAGLTRAPQIAFTGGDTVAIAYINNQGGGPEKVFVTSSIDAGLSWQLTHERVDASTRQAISPVVVGVLGGGLTNAALVGWIDFRGANGVRGDPFVRRIGH